METESLFVAQENRPNGDENKHSNSANCQISSAKYSLAYNSPGYTDLTYK